MQSIRIGISACLLGAEVRFDGGHKRDAFLTDTLGRYVEFVPVCPEVEIGLGVPRNTMRLVDRGNGVRLVESLAGDSGGIHGRDHTGAMRAYARKRVENLAREDLCGYVLKSKSPSCGMERVRVHGANGAAPHDGRGIFAEALIRAYPDLPVEEEGRLSDPRHRENFIERVFAYRSLGLLFANPWKAADLIAFHTARELQLLSHSTGAYETLGRMVASAQPQRKLQQAYQREFMAAIRRPTTPARHAKVLRHIADHVRDKLDEAARCEFDDVIAGYRAGQLPLIIPTTLARHYARTFDIADLRGQTYLEAHPAELMLRNHV